tara:strand:- start:31 stop:561 length:531 start_codon:yes stop_codon:yes gene_type:complete
MSSPFQKNFSAKSPLNGNYYSGVDGIKYVSPKPGVIDIPQGTKKKEEKEVTKVPETKKTFDFGSKDIDTSIDVPESNFKFGGGGTPDPAEVVSKNRKDINNTQTLERKIKGETVQRFAKPGTPEYNRWLAAVTKDPSIEDKYKDRTLYQDQEQTGSITDGKTILGDWTNVGKEYEK